MKNSNRTSFLLFIAIGAMMAGNVYMYVSTDKKLGELSNTISKKSVSLDTSIAQDEERHLLPASQRPIGLTQQQFKELKIFLKDTLINEMKVRREDGIAAGQSTLASTEIDKPITEEEYESTILLAEESLENMSYAERIPGDEINKYTEMVGKLDKDDRALLMNKLLDVVLEKETYQ